MFLYNWWNHSFLQTVKFSYCIERDSTFKAYVDRQPCSLTRLHSRLVSGLFYLDESLLVFFLGLFHQSQNHETCRRRGMAAPCMKHLRATWTEILRFVGCDFVYILAAVQRRTAWSADWHLSFLKISSVIWLEAKCTHQFFQGLGGWICFWMCN